MIYFVEKDPDKSESSLYGMILAPVFMVKDGIEYFVRNRVVDYMDKAWRDYEIKKSDREISEIKRFLEQNDGKYFKFNGAFDDPFEMLEDMKCKGHTFTRPNDLFLGCIKPNDGYLDFLGNRKEYSAAFHYRIYDYQMAKKIMTEVNV